MNRAEYINAVVTTGVVRKVIAEHEAVRILSSTVVCMNRDGHIDDDLAEIHREVFHRYDWVMHSEGKKPW